MTERFEPLPRDDDIDTGLAARVHDPLWLLCSQWQFGESRGEDAGSIAMVNVAAATHRIDEWRAGESDWRPYDPHTQPLERLVEEEPAEMSRDPRLRRQGGIRLARALTTAGLAPGPWVRRYAFADTDAERAPRGLPAMIRGRTGDGAKIAVGLRRLSDPATADDEAAALELAAAQRGGAAADLAADWLQWWDGRAPRTEPAAPEPHSAPPAWDDRRLEHSIAARATGLASTDLRAVEYEGGRLDWWTLDAVAPMGDGNAAADPVTLSLRGIPASAAFGGMPTARFWEMEYARIDFGSVDAAPRDLGRMLMLSYATFYGNDWYVAPVRLPIGTLCRIDTFTVRDVFGARVDIGPVGADSQEFHLFGLSDDREPSGASPWFLLAPALPGSLESPPIESVLIARDEMANLAWAIEHRIEDDAGTSFDRYDTMTRPRRSEPAAVPAYHVDTPVPEFWYPVAPEQLPDRESVRLRLIPLSRRDVSAPGGITDAAWRPSRGRPHGGGVLAARGGGAPLGDRRHPQSSACSLARRIGALVDHAAQRVGFRRIVERPGVRHRRQARERWCPMTLGESTWYVDANGGLARVDVSGGFDRWTMTRAVHESFPALPAFGVRRQNTPASPLTENTPGTVISAFQTGPHELLLRISAARWVTEFNRFPVERAVRLDVATGALVEYPAPVGAAIYEDGWRRYRIFANQSWDILNTVTKEFIANHAWTDSVFELPGGGTVGLPTGSTLGVVDGRLFIRPDGTDWNYRVFDLNNLVTDGVDHGAKDPFFPIPNRMTRVWSMITDPDSWYERRPGGEFTRDVLEAINTTALETGGGAVELLSVMNAESGLRMNAYHPAGRYGLLQMTADQLGAAGWVGTPDEFLEAAQGQISVIRTYLGTLGVPQETDETGLWLCLLLPPQDRVGVGPDTVIAAPDGPRPELWATHRVAERARLRLRTSRGDRSAGGNACAAYQAGSGDGQLRGLTAVSMIGKEIMSSTSLDLGEIVNAEIRDPSGAVTPFSHDYPVDPSSLVRIPSLSPIAAQAIALTQLRTEIENSLVNQGLFSSVTVNLNLLSTTVDFQTTISPGQTLFLRILETDGSVNAGSGSFTVDPSGIINIPFLGGTFVDGAQLFEAEHQIEQGLMDGGFFAQPLVNVTRVRLA